MRATMAEAVRHLIDNQAVRGLFRGVLDEQDFDPARVQEKLALLGRHCGRYVKLFELLAASHPLQRAPEYVPALQAHLRTLRERQAAEFPLRADPAAHLKEDYGLCRQGLLVAHVLRTGKQLKEHGPWLEGAGRHPPAPWTPLDGSPLDLGGLLIDDRLGGEGRSYLRGALAKAIAIVEDIFEAYSMPDFDPAEFQAVVEGALGQLERIPELSRCKNALRIMRSSGGTLKKNFGSYYRSYLVSGNQALMLEDYIRDTAKESGKEGGSPGLSREFQQIIAFYTKAIHRASSTGNSELQKVVSILDRAVAGYAGAEKDGAGGEAAPAGEAGASDAGPAAAAARPSQRTAKALRAARRELDKTLDAP